MITERLVNFYQLAPSGRPPKRADRSGAGYLPSRALRYCDALTSATGYGYWVFPPMSFRLLWDGEQIFWSTDEDEDWRAVSSTDSGSIQLPGFSDVFDDMAPAYLAGYSPPFLTALPEHGGVQIWTGLLVGTRPGWSLNVRAPVNLPGIPGLEAWEGVVETDVWFGPLFNNFRITRTDFPVVIRASAPFLQVQPVPQLAYSDETQADFDCLTGADLGETAWQELSKILLPNPDWEARQGEYAVRVRKRRACPIDHRNIVPRTKDTSRTDGQ